MKNGNCIGALLTVLMALGAAGCGTTPATGENADPSSLWEIHKDYFSIGIGVVPNDIQAPDRMATVLRHFNSITMGNEMKPDYVLDYDKCSADPEKYDLSPAIHTRNMDIGLKFAQEHGIKLRFHTLVWHAQTPAWFFREKYSRDPDAPFVSREIMLARMENYIKQALEYCQQNYPGIVYAVDVVNEAIEPGDRSAENTGSIRTRIDGKVNPWYATVGADYVEKAFTFARKYAAPDIKLIYNDYGCYNRAKLFAIHELVSGLYAKGIIDGVGMQSHIGMEDPSLTDYQYAITRLGEIGVELQITELDVGLASNSPDDLAALGSRYKRIMTMYRYVDEHKLANITNVTVWGLTDEGSWLNNAEGAKYPLLFDHNLQPKAAFFGFALDDSVPLIYRRNTTTTNTNAGVTVMTNENAAQNPIIWADIPDPDVIRVGDAYYMTSTTMHFSPGVPVMKSSDLIHWNIVNYVYDILEDDVSMNLVNGNNAYGKGSWASSLRYHNGVYYVSFLAYNTGKTYIYQTADIEHGPWRRSVINGIYHDMSLLFDDDRVYMVYGGGTIRIIELNADLSGIKTNGLNRVIIESADVAGKGGLNAEGSHLYKINGRYYLFLIAWPQGGRRTEVCYRANNIEGPYEGRVVLSDDLGFNNAGVAQGGIVDTPDGDWYALLFQDHGSVGRIPALVPITWENDFPVFGVNGKVPKELAIPATTANIVSNIVVSDDFAEKSLSLAWQWNHNPDNNNWSLSTRAGYLRFSSARINTGIIDARNTLTQRMFGPVCVASVALDVSGMRDGDVAGFAAFQDHYGFVGVAMENGAKAIVMRSAVSGKETEIAHAPLSGNTVYLKITGDFRNAADRAYFAYSADGAKWEPIGNTLQMSYLLTHFVGYRFALFYYATKSAGGHVDFDYFHLEDQGQTS
jgi:beta-xylosidase/GH35 family endo-1,4-beta-xylanase